MQRRWKKLSGLVAIALLFTSCGHKKDMTPYADIPKSSIDAARTSDTLIAFLKSHPQTHLQPEDITGVELIFEGNLEAAQRSLNKAVNINPQSSTSHFLNGLVYHLQAKKGASSKLELAKVGYDLALKYDPNNAHAAYYRGILHFENKEYASAQSDFAQAAILRPEDPHILYGLAASAYYMGEFELAAGAIMQALEKAPNSKRYLHTAALILGAGGDKVKAKTYQEKLGKESNNTRQNKFLERRLKEWEGVHQKVLKMASFSSFVSQGLSSSFANIGGGGGGGGDGYGGGGNAYGEAGSGEGSGGAMPGAPSSSSSSSSTEEKMSDNMVIRPPAKYK